MKAPAASTSAQALIPVLNRYGLTLDNMVITIDGTNEVLPNHAPIISVNDKELVLRTQEEFQGNMQIYAMNKVVVWLPRTRSSEFLLDRNRFRPSVSYLYLYFIAWLHRDHDESLNNKSSANRKATASMISVDDRRFKLKDFTSGNHKHSVTTDLSSTNDLSTSKHNLTNGHKVGRRRNFLSIFSLICITVLFRAAVC